MFIYYALFFLGVQFILLVVYYNLHVQTDITSVRNIVRTQFFRMVVYSAIWISFVKRSERVKQTFIYPHS